MQIDTQIEVTMTMNLAEAKIIRDALDATSDNEVPGSYAVFTDVQAGLARAGVR